MDKRLEKLLKDIKANNGMSYDDQSPQRLITNIGLLNDDGYVTITPTQDGYSVTITDAGNALLNS